MNKCCFLCQGWSCCSHGGSKAEFLCISVTSAAAAARTAQAVSVWDGSQSCCEADSELLGPALHQQGSHVSWTCQHLLCPCQVCPTVEISSVRRQPEAQTAAAGEEWHEQTKSELSVSILFVALSVLWCCLFWWQNTPWSHCTPVVFGEWCPPYLFESRWDVQTFPCLNLKLFLQ